MTIPITDMPAIKRFLPNLTSAFSVVIMVVLWLTFAPTQAGGLASYIIVIGSSMEPTFHIGDLVIVHQEPLYQVGDAVVYKNLELGSYVFHRVVSQKMGRFTLQGDNNSWLDTYQPDQKEILGKLWLHIPHGGMTIQKIRNPFVMAAIAAGLAAILAGSLFRKKTKGNTLMNNNSVREWFTSIKQKTRGLFIQTKHHEHKKASHLPEGETWDGLFFVLGAVLLSSLILGIISFSRPASRIAQDNIQYQHLGIFSYLAPAPLGVYDSNAIKSGDPIFPRLTCSVDVTLQYTLIAQEVKNITGTYQLTAVIREQVSGWERRVPLQQEMSFSSTTFSTTAKLDLCKMETLTQSMEQETDFHPGSYTLSVVPNVKLAGELSGYALDSSFDTGLAFVYDHVHFYMVQDEEAGNPLSLTETETINEDRSVVNTIAFPGKPISVPMLRWVAVIGLIISVSGLILLGTKLQTLAQSDQQRFFRVRYDSLIVDIRNIEMTALNIVDIRSMEALAKLAERFNAVILHKEDGQSHTYYVQAAGTTYRFVSKATETESTLPANEAEHKEGDE